MDELLLDHWRWRTPRRACTTGTGRGEKVGAKDRTAVSGRVRPAPPVHDEDPRGEGREFRGVGDHDDGRPLLVEPVEELHHLLFRREFRSAVVVCEK